MNTPEIDYQERFRRAMPNVYKCIKTKEEWAKNPDTGIPRLLRQAQNGGFPNPLKG